MPRIWYGVHPAELDKHRLLILHRDAHSLLAQIRMAQEESAPYMTRNIDVTQEVAELIYLHNLVAEYAFPIFGVMHDSPLLLPPEMLHQRTLGASVLDGLAPNAWPPTYVSVRQRIADLKDLQARWRVEGRRTEFRRSVERYGLWQSGTLTDVEQFPANQVTDAEVAVYMNHRRRYAQAKTIPAPVPNEPVLDAV